MDAPEYGRKLTDEEYQARIAELYGGRAGPYSDEADRELRRRELELRIDYRLGRDFPRERRAALWEVQERIERKRLGLAFRHAMRRLFHRLTQHETQRFAQFSAQEFGRVLSAGELKCFLDLEEGEVPTLPFDMR
ncbi:MAG: hypothetical protein A3D95_04265 [Betaproteobacteria bacterium RIFCSPHIGHO2_12_FULL_69_13]|nr:MAG: hypothetical protein A3D95_04265 [Betaproteobacteria bacterium RIFCSPHIGHO2_12_FULL_69_13]OGA67214.1 MAG: hypothetical protein A3G83_05715 [Betaproteobacteria bacterium RIFCSPLOWO2_12_FULL_68_20]